MIMKLFEGRDNMLQVFIISVACIKKTKSRVSAISLNLYTVNWLRKVELYSRWDYKLCYLPAMIFELFEACDNTLQLYITNVSCIKKIKTKMSANSIKFYAVT